LYIGSCARQKNGNFCLHVHAQIGADHGSERMPEIE